MVPIPSGVGTFYFSKLLHLFVAISWNIRYYVTIRVTAKILNSYLFENLYLQISGSTGRFGQQKNDNR